MTISRVNAGSTAVSPPSPTEAGHHPEAVPATPVLVLQPLTPREIIQPSEAPALPTPPPPLHDAARAGNIRATEQLLAHYDPATPDADERTALHYAAEFTENNHLVSQLVSCGADLDATDAGGYTAAQLAARAGHDGVVRQLVAMAPARLAKSSRHERIQRLFGGEKPNPGLSFEVIDAQAAKLLQKSVEDLNDPRTLATYLSQLYSRAEPTLGVQANGWDWEPMLEQRIRSLITLLLIAPESALPAAQRQQLVNEVAVQLDALHLARGFHSLENLRDAQACNAMVDLEAQRLAQRASELPEGAEIAVPLSFAGHAMYAGLRRRQVGDIPVVTFRLDNVGSGALNNPDGRVRPLAFNIPIDTGIEALQDLLATLIAQGLQGAAPEAVFNGTLFAFIAKAKQNSETATLIDRTPFDSSEYFHRAQTGPNCVLKNFSVGMAARLGRPLFRFVKASERAFCRQRCFQLTFTEAAFERSQQITLLKRLEELVLSPVPRLDDLQRFLEKPARELIVDSLKPETIYHLIATHEMATMRLLLKFGCSLTKRDATGARPLHWAVRAGNLDMVALVVEQGAATINDRDSLGRTPLHEAVAMGRTDIAEVLLRYGANLQQKDHEGITPQDLANEKFLNAGALHKALGGLQALLPGIG